jgi:hypothetical protein
VNKGYETMIRHSCLEGVREAGVVLMVPEYTAHNVITCMHVHVLVWPSCERHSRPPGHPGSGLKNRRMANTVRNTFGIKIRVREKYTPSAGVQNRT